MHPHAPNASVCIVDDDEQVRRFLVEVFTSVGLRVEAFAGGEDFMRAWQPSGPSCILLDLRMPRVSGTEVHDWLRATHPHIPVIFLTGYADVPTAVSAMRHGAFDFLEKPFNIQHLIERTQEGLRRFFPPTAGERQTSATWLPTLTPREREVLDAIVAGQRNKTIAINFGISERTVETHRASIMHKSGTHSIAELVAVVLANSSGR